MANTLLGIKELTREAVELFTNSNAFLKSIEEDYAYVSPPQWTKTNPSYQTAAELAQEAEEFLGYLPERFVDVTTLTLDDFSELVLAPTVNHLADAVAYSIMGASKYEDGLGVSIGSKLHIRMPDDFKIRTS